MNLIRELLLFVVIYIVIRNLGRMFMGGGARQTPGNPGQQPSGPQGMIQDTMVPCATCGTYNASRDVYERNGKFFCNENCFNKSTGRGE